MKKSKQDAKTPENIAAWLTKLQASERLGVTQKTIDRMVERGQLRKMYRQGFGSGAQRVVVLDPDDIDKIREERMMHAPEAELVDENEAVPTSASAEKAMVLHKGHHAAVPVSQPGAPAFWPSFLNAQLAVALKDKLTLTLKEAHEYSGLPIELLREWAKSGKVKTFRGRGWLFVRESLREAIEG